MKNVGRTRYWMLVAVAASVVLLVTFASNHAEANRMEYGNHSFRGNYGLIERGWLNGLNWSEVGVIHADGRGHMELEFVGTLGGTLKIEGTVSCSYEVRSNGMGTMQCQQEGVPDFESSIVLSDRGREMNFITSPLPSGGQSMGTARRQ